jgi:hypothetical protein
VTKGKGYLLPSGDATEDELECCLVFYPARDEYRRALMGSLDYLATWIAWERDSEKRGKDAAASWKLANIQTWECCSMGFCDDLATTLQELLAATQALECCGEQDITDGRQYTDEIEDGVGDVPQNIIDAGYADDAADWDGFNDYKCMISHLAVDHVESFFREIAPHISDTGIVIGGVGVVGALVGAILTVAGLPISAGIIIALGAAAAIWTWIVTEGRQAVEDLADEIAANHDALACAIYEGDGVTDAVSDFNDEVDSLFSGTDAVAIKSINIEPQLRAMYAGRYDQEDIAQSLADKGYATSSYTCICEEDPPPSGYHLEFPPGTPSWQWLSGQLNRVYDYDDTTGMMTASWDQNTAAYQVDIRLTFVNALMFHGFVMELISFVGPSDLKSRIDGISFATPAYPVTMGVGQSAAGYRDDLHSGSAWDDWVNQFDFVDNAQDNDQIFSTRETPDMSAPGSAHYEIALRLRRLIAD